MADQKAFSEIRHEVYKFGLQGFDKKVQVNARYEQAIKLGAKQKSWIKPHNNLGERSQKERSNVKQLQNNHSDDDNQRYQLTKPQEKIRNKLKQKLKQKQKQRPKQTTNHKRKSNKSKV